MAGMTSYKEQSCKFPVAVVLYIFSIPYRNRSEQISVLDAMTPHRPSQLRSTHPFPYHSRRMIEGNLHASYISKTFPRFNGWKNNSQNRLKHLGTLHVYGATRSSHYYDSGVRYLLAIPSNMSVIPRYNNIAVIME